MNRRSFSAWVLVVVGHLGLLAAEARAGAPVVLRALVPTGAAAGGTSVGALIDGRPETVWKLDALGQDEGVLFRFEADQDLTTVQLYPCKDGARPGSTSDAAPWTAFVNGRAVASPTRRQTADRAVLEVPAPGRTATVFVRADAPRGCLEEVVFVSKQGPLDVRAPRVVRAKLTTSKTLAPVDVYHPAFLFDQRPEFGWVEGDKGPGTGATVEVVFDDAVSLVGIEVSNGYHRSDDHYRKNARAKTILFAVNGSDAGAFDLLDARTPVRRYLKAQDVRSLRLTVTEVIRGTKYEDLVLSELRFFDDAGPFTVELPVLAEREQLLRKKAAGTLLGEVLDRRWVSACAGGDDAAVAVTLKLRGNQTFVVYDARESLDASSGGEPTWSAEEVFDGAWNLEKSSADEVVVGLYGRRHTTRTTREDVGDWQPYGENAGGPTESSSTRTRIGGGKLKLRRLAAVAPASRPSWLKDPTCAAPEGAVLVEHPSFTALVGTGR